MRISDWSSDVCSSDLCLLRLTTMMTGPSGAASGAQRNCPGCRFWAVAAIEPSSSLAWANAGGIAKPNALIVAVASKERRVRGEDEPIVRSEERRVGKEGVSKC